MILDLGQLQTGFDWIQVTAQYSNAVLVAMLPYVNDVAQKLDLPIPHPITAEHLSYFDIAPRRNFMVAMGVQGGWHFGSPACSVRPPAMICAPLACSALQ